MGRSFHAGMRTPGSYNDLDPIANGLCEAWSARPVTADRRAGNSPNAGWPRPSPHNLLGWSHHANITVNIARIVHRVGRLTDFCAYRSYGIQQQPANSRQDPKGKPSLNDRRNVALSPL